MFSTAYTIPTYTAGILFVYIIINYNVRIRDTIVPGPILGGGVSRKGYLWCQIYGAADIEKNYNLNPITIDDFGKFSA